jgi:hypothetical protein
MNEGAVTMSPTKSPKQLFPNFFTCQLLAIIQKERIIHLITSHAKNTDSRSLGALSNENLVKLKELSMIINYTNYYGSFPISQYTEIQDIYCHLKSNILSGSDFESIQSTLNELTLILQEETERKINHRDKTIGLILGVLGISGFISFIFDYFYVSKNQKFLDGLEFPFNLLPIVVFLLSFILIWRFISKN